jgi:hypothetical protein
MDCHEFRKDGIVLLRLYGRSQLGQFTAFEKMVVTDAGVRRGYSSFEYGQLVNTPWARQLQGSRVKMPIRTGMLYRILLGPSTATGKKKKANQQQRLLCLSLVEKQSTFGDGITDPRGSEENWGDNWNLEATEYYRKLYAAAGDGKPLTTKDFVWVFTTPQLTRGTAFQEIYCEEETGEYPYAAEHPWNGGTGENLPKYYASGNTLKDLMWTLKYLQPTANGDSCNGVVTGLKELAIAEIVNFAPPSVNTALGQAKRMQLKVKSQATGKRKKSGDDSDSDS